MDIKPITRSLAIATALVALATAAVPGEAAAQSAWEQIKATGAFRTGSMPARAPYMWQKPGESEWHGFSMDMAREIAKKLAAEMGRGIKVEYVPTTWATVVLDIQANKIDAFFGMSETEERLKALDMAGPLYALAHVFVDRAGFNVGDTWAAYNKPEVRISVNMGTSDEAAIRKHSPNATILQFKGGPESILAVQAGRADTWGTSVMAALDGKGKNPAFGRIVIPKPVQSLPSSAGLRKDGDGRFTKFMQAWADDARKTGHVKKLILDNMRAGGMNPEDLPPEMEF